MGEEALKKCLILKTCELCMHLERAKIKGISQHLWAEMHMWIHRHLEENSQPLIRVEQQLVTMVQSEDQLCHSDGYTKSQTLLAKAATVTSEPQAGKSRFGSRQRKFSRSLALTSCCHGAEKLHEQPHTKPLTALPKGKRVSPRWTVQVHTFDGQIWTVFLDFPWCTL